MTPSSLLSPLPPNDTNDQLVSWIIDMYKAAKSGMAQSGSDKHYTHTQSELSCEWIVSHNLEKYPSVTVVDSGGTQWLTTVEYVSKNTLIVKTAFPFSGTAYCN